MSRLALLLTLLCGGYCTVSVGQEFDGACMLVTPTMQWSGVAISSTEILTVAHHDLKVGAAVRAEFPEHRHGGITRVSLVANVKRIQRKADLSLLVFKSPDWVTIKQYRLPDKNPFTLKVRTKVRINGYVDSMPVFASVNYERGDITVENTDQILVDQFQGRAVSGMSGSPVLIDDVLVGVQFGGGDTVIHAASVNTIREFLK